MSGTVKAGGFFTVLSKLPKYEGVQKRVASVPKAQQELAPKTL
jgi:hypothetical protein